MSIPRKIHYCWLSNDPVPENMKQYIDGWRQMLPDYEFIKWGFNRFNKESSIWVSEAFDHKKYAFASDYIRLYAVYNYGGIYLDMDVEVLKAFDDMLERSYMLAYERPDKNWIEAGCFGAEKNDPFIKACLDYYENRHFVKEDGFLDTLPLSRIMSDVMMEKNISRNIYSWEFFTAKSFETGKETPTDNTYAIHHFAGSWKTKDERKTIEKARNIRNSHPFIGRYVAFIYEKTVKAISIIKEGSVKELLYRIRQYIRGIR